MRIVFMGTPQFAVPSLKALIEAGHEVCGVFSQPDKPVGRHQNKLKPTPVKECALSYQAAGRDIPVYQPEKLRDGTALAILNGEKETGVTIMHMAAELDAGDIILQTATPIHPEEDAEMLYARLAELGGPLLVEAVAQIEAGTAARTPQDPNGVSFAPMLSKELSPVDWSRSAQEIHDQIRGLMAWPRASTDVLGGEAVKLYRSQVLAEKRSGTAGTVLGGGKAGIDVLCGDGKVLRITELQAPGSRRMSAADYLRGHPLGN